MADQRDVRITHFPNEDNSKHRVVWDIAKFIMRSEKLPSDKTETRLHVLELVEQVHAVLIEGRPAQQVLDGEEYGIGISI